MRRQAVLHWFVLNYHRTIQLPGFQISPGSAAHQELVYLGSPESDVVYEWQALAEWLELTDVEFVHRGDEVLPPHIRHLCDGSRSDESQLITDIESRRAF